MPRRLGISTADVVFTLKALIRVQCKIWAFLREQGRK